MSVHLYNVINTLMHIDRNIPTDNNIVRGYRRVRTKELATTMTSEQCTIIQIPHLKVSVCKQKISFDIYLN